MFALEVVEPAVPVATQPAGLCSVASPTVLSDTPGRSIGRDSFVIDTTYDQDVSRPGRLRRWRRDFEDGEIKGYTVKRPPCKKVHQTATKPKLGAKLQKSTAKAVINATWRLAKYRSTCTNQERKIGCNTIPDVEDAEDQTERPDPLQMPT